MYNFSYDKIRDFKFDKEGYATERRLDGIRREYNSTKIDLISACIDFLRRKDNGFLYDIDEEVIDDSNGEHHFIEFTQDWNGSWYFRHNGKIHNKWTEFVLAVAGSGNKNSNDK